MPENQATSAQFTAPKNDQSICTRNPSPHTAPNVATIARKPAPIRHNLSELRITHPSDASREEQGDSPRTIAPGPGCSHLPPVHLFCACYQARTQCSVTDPTKKDGTPSRGARRNGEPTGSYPIDTEHASVYDPARQSEHWQPY